MSKYSFEYTRSARKDLFDLEKMIIRRIAEKIFQLCENPRPRGCIKLSGADNLWRVKVGDYRIIYFVYDEKRLIKIAVIAHRKEVYRKI